MSETAGYTDLHIPNDEYDKLRRFIVDVSDEAEVMLSRIKALQQDDVLPVLMSYDMFGDDYKYILEEDVKALTNLRKNAKSVAEHVLGLKI